MGVKMKMSKKLIEPKRISSRSLVAGAWFALAMLALAALCLCAAAENFKDMSDYMAEGEFLDSLHHTSLWYV